MAPVITPMNLTQKQDKKTGRGVSAVHVREDDGSYTALCTIDVRNLANPREVWADLPETTGVTCRACKAVLTARRLRDYATIPGPLKTTVLLDFATWFEKNARGEHA